MLDPMKTHPIKSGLYPQLRFDFYNHTFVFRNVPQKEVEGILKKLKSLEKYRAIDTDTVIIENSPVLNALLAEVGGEAVYRNGAVALKSCRKEAGLSQTALAHMIRRDQGAISKMERAKIPIGKKMAKKFADIFNVSYQIFLQR